MKGSTMSSLMKRAALYAGVVSALALLSGCPTNDSGSTGGTNPPSKADVGGTCSNNDGCNSNICVSGTCRACAPGAAACECLSNQTCNAGLVCNANVCQTCAAGAQGCACRADTTCDGTLQCSNGVCVTPSCPAGTVGCACTAAGACTGGVCVNSMCAACNDSTAGCPCSNGSTCGGGLVCESNACRAPKTCAEAACVPNQVCTPPSAGVDARCENSCVAGFTFNAVTGACDPIPTANCTAGAAGSILATCQGQNRACDTTASGAQCGACVPSFIDDTANPQNCRAVRTCADIQATCTTQNRDCTPATTTADAVCGACSAGYVPDLAGNCTVDVPPATCDADGGPGSIVATCQARGRECTTPDGGSVAECGACLAGQVEDTADPLRCVVPRVCADISPSCNSLGRECTGSPRAECGNCISGLVPDTPNNAAACRQPRSCNDPAFPGCGITEFCIDGPGMEARCESWPCTNALGLPDTTKARRVDTNTCVTCPISCNEPGATGRLWPFTVAGSNTCICETEPGFYYDTSGVFTTGRCDADGDGWVREAARGLIFPTNNDPATKANARCDLKRIERVRLVNEWEESIELLLCAGSAVLVDGPTTACNTEATVYMFESTRNDDQNQIQSSIGPDLPAYSNGTEGRRLRAAEINPLTKACASNQADYNDDNLPDMTQNQRMAPGSGLGVEYAQLMPFAYFMELHQGYYEPAPDGGGTYVIKERSRCDPSFLLGYLDTTNDYWKQCSRYLDRSYATAALPDQLKGRDFAQYACRGSDSCLPAPPTNVRPSGGVIPPHGLCEVAKPPTGAAAGWRGMMHFSQFRCVEVVNTVTDTVSQRTVDRLAANGGDKTREVFNRCGVDCPDGDAACATDCSSALGPCTTSSLPQGTGANSSAPKLACTPTGSVAVGQVGFVAMNFVDENTDRGCLDEYNAWNLLCPGYDANNPSIISGTGEPNNFGELVCGCSENYGGPDCDIGCPDSELFLDQNYRVADRSGYWMCAAPSRLGPGTLTGTSGTDTYTLRGDIPLSGASGTLCEVAGCATGYVLR